MDNAILWGLIQGLSEFLPISSDGHLILVPALLGREGPDLGTTAVLHIGTLVSVLVYYRAEIAEMLRFTPEGRRLLWFVVIGTIPAAVVGLAFYSFFDEVGEDPKVVAALMIAAGVMMVLTRYIAVGDRRREDVTFTDAVAIGSTQAIALLPGVTRSGITIATGLGRRFDRAEAANLSFLMGIPAIAGAGLLGLLDVSGEGGVGLDFSLVVGTVVAGVTGYFAIRFLVKFIGRVGLVPFGIYCIAFGGLSLILL